MPRLFHSKPSFIFLFVLVGIADIQTKCSAQLVSEVSFSTSAAGCHSRYCRKHHAKVYRKRCALRPTGSQAQVLNHRGTKRSAMASRVMSDRARARNKEGGSNYLFCGDQVSFTTPPIHVAPAASLHG